MRTIRDHLSHRYGSENVEVLARAYAETLTIVSLSGSQTLPAGEVRLALVEAMIDEAQRGGFNVDRLTMAALGAMPEVDWTKLSYEPSEIELVHQERPKSFGWVRSVGDDRRGVTAWERPDGSICGTVAE